jgi:hypothetical protein
MVGITRIKAGINHQQRLPPCPGRCIIEDSHKYVICREKQSYAVVAVVFLLLKCSMNNNDVFRRGVSNDLDAAWLTGVGRPVKVNAGPKPHPSIAIISTLTMSKIFHKDPIEVFIDSNHFGALPRFPDGSRAY